MDKSCVPTPSTGPWIRSMESVWWEGLNSLWFKSILFLNRIPFSWARKDEKLSTKNPDLNRFNPWESGIKRLAVLVSNKDNIQEFLFYSLVVWYQPFYISYALRNS